MEKNSLAKLSLGINALLIVSVIVLFTRTPGSSDAQSDSEDSTTVEFTDEGASRIAYFSNDSLNLKCQFVQDVQEDANRVSIDAQKKIESKQYEITNWQKKWESKGELLEREYVKAQEEGAKLQEEYLALQQNLQVEVGQKTEQLMMTMYNRMSVYAQGFCEKNNIDMLVGYQLGGDIYYVNPNLEVTTEFINFANAEYSSSFDSDEEEES
jgi:Skp family chaperone for outer membrane proteins